jgi:hypothetical protein
MKRKRENSTMPNRLSGVGLLFVAALVLSPALSAQSAKPAAASQAKATPDSKSASAAKTPEHVPDFSGVWEPHMPPTARGWSGYGITGEIPPMTAWGKAQYDANRPTWGPHAITDSDDPVNPTNGKDVGCFPTGVPRIYVHPFPMEIVQIPGRVIQLFEFNHFVRQLYTNGPREHAKDIDPSWMGDSIAWWEGDTLVVDSTSFNGKTWVDRAGLPSSDQLHVIERISRPTKNKLVVHITVDDPKTYTKTWEGEREYIYEPDWKLVEMICEDNVTFNDLKNQGKEQ